MFTPARSLARSPQADLDPPFAPVTATTLVAQDKAIHCYKLITTCSQERDCMQYKNVRSSALVLLLTCVLALIVRLLLSIKVRIAIQTAIIDLGTP